MGAPGGGPEGATGGLGAFGGRSGPPGGGPGGGLAGAEGGLGSFGGWGGPPGGGPEGGRAERMVAFLFALLCTVCAVGDIFGSTMALGINAANTCDFTTTFCDNERSRDPEFGDNCAASAVSSVRVSSAFSPAFSPAFSAASSADTVSAARELAKSAADRRPNTVDIRRSLPSRLFVGWCCASGNPAASPSPPFAPSAPAAAGMIAAGPDPASTAWTTCGGSGDTPYLSMHVSWIRSKGSSG